MKLPKIDTPIFEIKLHSVDKPVKFRPFTVKEEKILLIAEEGKDGNDIMTAVRQVINNCCISDIDVNKLPIFDIEYFLLQLRSKSVNNMSTVRYKDTSDNITRDFEIDLDKIKLTVDKKHSNVVKLTNSITVKFKYPSIDTVIKLKDSTGDIEYLAECIDKVFEDDEVYEASNFSLKEKVEFIESLSTKMFEKISETFVKTMPKLSHTIEYSNKEGEKRKIVLEGYRNFFQ
jgi:hypothetical protein